MIVVLHAVGFISGGLRVEGNCTDRYMSSETQWDSNVL